MRAFNPACEPYNPGAAREYLGKVPETPGKADLGSLIPFLVRLALIEKKMYWRLWLVATLVFTSKAAGGHVANFCLNDDVDQAQTGRRFAECRSTIHILY